MKKICVILILCFSGLAVSAQDVKFGLQGGFTSLNGKSSNSLENISYSGTSSGFYLGGLLNFQLSEAIHLQPSVNYVNADEENLLMIPVIFQYYIENSGFYFLGGPQATLMLNQSSINGIDVFKVFGFDLAIGAGYTINENFFIEAKYSFELTNRYSSDIQDAAGSVEVDSKINAFTLGVGYKF
ncbi:outer membrane beta-barrel protein [Zunongwangia sp. HGR-M22]|uniref:outer membrane beta-barrel protein n=1 Tax=Zunongwangia sp. HGR-M22 TaxID=3015168 RepID=UPI0022DCFBBE|nr:outer membrane beta-barrel protein [Zunongwangia sp. HGR-M22]WBL24472.1 outer membrane beta-barrel protein [Zunongwangia sp. HGR-M22]